MLPSPSLRDVELDLLTAISGRTDVQRVPIACLVRGDGRASAEDRVAIYAHGYLARLVEVLSNDFPVLAATLGREAFLDLVRRYLDAHPPRSWTLRDLGAALPGFLASHGAAETDRCPFAADLAELEWSLVTVFDAADARSLTREELAALTPEGWSELVVSRIPALRVLELAHPVHELDLERVPAPTLAPRPTSLCVWRHGERLLHRPLDGFERRALSRLEQPVSLCDLLEDLAAFDPDDEPAPTLVAALERWTRDGVLAVVSAP